MKLFVSDKKYEKDITEKGRQRAVEFAEDISKKLPPRANLSFAIIPEQLRRIEKDIGTWRSNVDSAEDITNPDREALMEMYRDFVDDYQLWSAMQQRINKAITGNFIIVDEEGMKDEEETKKFLDPKNFPLQWFRDFMRIAINAKFYGYEVAQLGDIVDDKFRYVEKIPEQNLIPYYHSVILDIRHGYIAGGGNTVDIEEEPYRTWTIGIGSPTDLGLINKCAPYVIYKQVFGSWSQHADLFGMPLRIGKTELRDNERRQNMIDMFENMEGATFGIFDPDDNVEFVEQKGSSDPHNIYGQLIRKCDQAMAKIILSQTGTTDEKSFAGSAQVHEKILDDLIFADKLDIAALVNDELIPRMKKLGMIAKEKKIFGVWDFTEKVSIKEWAEIIKNLALIYNIPPEEVEGKIGIKIEELDEVDKLPENKMTSIMNKMKDYYKLEMIKHE